MCDIVFEKVRGRDGTVNRMSDRQKQSSKGFYIEGISQNLQEDTCDGDFFDKVRRCRSETSLKTRLQYRSFLVNFAKFLRKPFLQNTTGWLFLMIAVLIVVKVKLGHETVNYDLQKLKHPNLTLKCKLSRRAIHAK